MPRYKVETMATVRRVYDVDAENEDAAEAMIGGDTLVIEEEIDEYVDRLRLMPPDQEIEAGKS
jgi:hypothetical protein